MPTLTIPLPERTKPVPLADEHSQHYWDAAAEHRLLIQRCGSCGRHQFYPRRHCVHCFALDPEWVEASGRGRVHTFSVVQRSANPEFAADCPYVLAIVELDEGVRLTSRILAAPEQVSCELPVHAVWPEPADGAPQLPLFAPTDSAR